jgi:hypothetical protein
MKLITSVFAAAVLINIYAGAATRAFGQQPAPAAAAQQKKSAPAAVQQPAAKQAAAPAPQAAKKQRRQRRKPAAVKPAMDPKKMNSLLYGVMERLDTLSALYENLGLRLSTDTLKKAYELDKTVNKAAAAYFKTAEPRPDRESLKNYRGLLESVMRSVRTLKELKDRMPAAEMEPAILAARDLYQAMDQELAGPSLVAVTVDPKLQAARSRSQSGSGEEIANQTETLFAISEITLALSACRREDGKFPGHLKDLAPKYIPAIPAVSVANHPKTAEIVEIDSRNYDADYTKAFNDTGKWLYFSNKKSKYYGRVFVDCTHKNAQGVEFYRIGETK